MPTAGWRARISRAARRPSSVCVGRHADVDDRDVGRVRVDARAAGPPPWPLCADDLEAGLGEQRARCPRARAGRRRRARRARDLRAHGRPVAGRAETRSRPSSASTRSARPRRPEPPRGVGAADAVVGDLDDQRAVRSRVTATLAPTPARTSRRWPAPRRRRSTPRARPARAAARPARRPPRVATGDARRQRLERRRQARARAPRGGCRGRARAAPAATAASSSLRGRRAAPLRAGSRDAAWSSRSCSESATSRCCAPSWRLRSSRRRSASPAATIRCARALQLGQPRAQTRRAGARSRARSRPPRARLRAARGRRRARRRGRAPRRRPSRSITRRPRRSRPRGQRDRRAVGVGEGLANSGSQYASVEVGSPSVRASASLQRVALHRAQVAEQLGQAATSEA